MKVAMAFALVGVMLVVTGGCGRYYTYGWEFEEVTSFSGGRIALGWEKTDYTFGKTVVVGPVAWFDKSEMATVAPTRAYDMSPITLNTRTMQNMKVTVKTLDDKRVWLIHEEKVVASFDLENNLAILGPFAHPAWATVE
ncbi:MAG: hypothetical protein FWE88_04315 [Phycisphaerae bacterium]|nr:hypothetical protein [Phycisphaerae bacterium]